MNPLLKKIFINNWQRKAFALLLAVITWYVTNTHFTINKFIQDIPIKVVNLPEGKTVEGIENGFLSEKMSLSVVGNEEFLENLTGNDLQIIVDMKGKTDNCTTAISKNNLISTNPEISIDRTITKIVPKDLSIKLTKLITEKIPIVITHPIGESPRGYRFFDTWPYQLYITISGPEDTIKSLKAKPPSLTFNLNDISKNELDILQSSKKNKDIISFFVPTQWKKKKISSISSSPIEIDDPLAKELRIDFTKNDVLPINGYIPVSLFFPPQKSTVFNPKTISLLSNDIIIEKNGLKILNIPLYAQGVSELFLDVIKDSMQIFILVDSQNKKETLFWNVQCMLPLELEDIYVAKESQKALEEESLDLQPNLREEYLRNRFRKYMNNLRLFKAPDQKLHLNVLLEKNGVVVTQRD
jgi:hypothetical protein